MKNIDIVNTIVAKDLNLDVNIISEVNKFYWREGVLKKISNLESSAVFVKGLLTFTTSRYNIRNDIYKTISRIKNAKNNNFLSKLKKEDYIEQLYKRLRILLIERNNLAKLIYEQDNRIR